MPGFTITKESKSKRNLCLKWWHLFSEDLKNPYLFISTYHTNVPHCLHDTLRVKPINLWLQLDIEHRRDVPLGQAEEKMWALWAALKMLVSYPILALARGCSILESTLLVCVVHLPRGHCRVEEVSFQRLIVQTRPPTWAVKKTNLH